MFLFMLMLLIALLALLGGLVLKRAQSVNIEPPSTETVAAGAVETEPPQPTASATPSELVALVEPSQLPATAEPEPELYGSCRVTAYCSCVLCCGDYALSRPVDSSGNEIVYGAAGVPLTAGVSVACPLPIGTKLSIPDLGDTEYIVQDRTASWIVEKYDGMVVDVYFDSHEACYEWLAGHGQDYFDVYILEEVEDVRHLEH